VSTSRLQRVLAWPPRNPLIIKGLCAFVSFLLAEHFCGKMNTMTQQVRRTIEPAKCASRFSTQVSARRRNEGRNGVTVRQALCRNGRSLLSGDRRLECRRGEEGSGPCLFYLPPGFRLDRHRTDQPQATMTRLVSAASALQGATGKDDERRAQSARRPWRCTFGPRSMGSTAPMLPNPFGQGCFHKRNCALLHLARFADVGTRVAVLHRGGYEGPKS